MSLEFAVGNTLEVDGEFYRVTGKILYRNVDDNCRWVEYRIRHQDNGMERWLSYDDTYNEYSVSWVAGNISREGFHEVDRGTEEVLQVSGKVDVKVGDKAVFREYEDSSEEQIISVEVWEDGEEISCGYYLDWDEVRLVREWEKQGGQVREKQRRKNKNKNPAARKLLIVMGVFFAVNVGFAAIGMLTSGKRIEKYLKENSSVYSYETSITGNNEEKADVYRSAYDLDMTVRDIIDGIEGQTEDVQQNTEDGDDSVAILTSDEYCLVYVSEENEVLVQVCSRKYAYTTDKVPYHARSHTHRYFRRFYFTRGYDQDRNTFDNYATPYTGFDDTTVDKAPDPYQSYSTSVRQSSINSRSSSGGGISSGK
ncbi:MAG: DUF4178 domain-containing protein [Clostridiales bacterium]|nr:DUF4178 domain-containing protein [Clostridiales bacterium]